MHSTSSKSSFKNPSSPTLAPEKDDGRSKREAKGKEIAPRSERSQSPEGKPELVCKMSPQGPADDEATRRQNSRTGISGAENTVPYYHYFDEELEEWRLLRERQQIRIGEEGTELYELAQELRRVRLESFAENLNRVRKVHEDMRTSGKVARETPVETDNQILRDLLLADSSLPSSIAHLYSPGKEGEPSELYLRLANLLLRPVKVRNSDAAADTIDAGEKAFLCVDGRCKEVNDGKPDTLYNIKQHMDKACNLNVFCLRPIFERSVERLKSWSPILPVAFCVSHAPRDIVLAWEGLAQKERLEKIFLWMEHEHSLKAGSGREVLNHDFLCHGDGVPNLVLQEIRDFEKMMAAKSLEALVQAA